MSNDTEKRCPLKLCQRAAIALHGVEEAPNSLKIYEQTTLSIFKFLAPFVRQLGNMLDTTWLCLRMYNIALLCLEPVNGYFGGIYLPGYGEWTQLSPLYLLIYVVSVSK